MKTIAYNYHTGRQGEKGVKSWGANDVNTKYVPAYYIRIIEIGFLCSKITCLKIAGKLFIK